MKLKKLAATSAVAVMMVGGLAACADDADIASENVSKAADNFEVNRRIVAFNGITDKYLLEITGACSLKEEGDQLEVICKTGDESYVKHFVGLSDNVSYFAEQGEPIEASAYNYRVTFKPEAILPDPDFRSSEDPSGGNS